MSLTLDKPTAPTQEPSPGNQPTWLSTVLKHDVPASLVVFLVALPLSIGIAIASGAPIMAGLIAAVVGGVVAGILGGSPLQVSGPAAGLTVVVAELINEFGWKVTCLITVGAGVIQIIFGLSRIARIALAIAPVVVHAMLAGIGVTIALQQIHVLLGGSSKSSAWENLKSLPSSLTHLQFHHVIVGVVVIAVMLSWKYLPAKVRMIPGPLAAIVIATALSLLLPLDVDRIVLSGSIFDALSLPELPHGEWGEVIMGMLTIALIASVESLLSAVAVDKMHTGPRTDFNRELLGQGAANVTSGLIGGLPVTGVIVRSSTNVNVGAKTRASAVLHGIWILVFAALLTSVVEQIPKAALAGLLVVIGMQLVKIGHMKLARRTGDLSVYVVTLVAVVFLNLLEGVAIGLVLAIAIVVWRVVRANIRTEESKPGEWRVVVDGSATFLSLPKLTQVLQDLPKGSTVTVDLKVDFLDHAAYEVIEDWTRQHEATGGTVIMSESRIELASIASSPPRRLLAALVEGRSPAVPWKAWQSAEPASEMDSAPPALRPIAEGIQDYHRNSAHLVREHLDGFEHHQNPDSFFLTCADSRVVPNVITSSGPGDLFTIRNVGNLVPARGADPSVEAALDFAVNELGVTSVVVCGHSSCGAMKALLGGVTDGPVGEWLDQGQPSLAALRSGHPAGRSAAEAGYSEADQLSIVNVALQVQTLSRHPLIGKAAAEGRVRVAGLFFDISTARVIGVTQTGLIDPQD